MSDTKKPQDHKAPAETLADMEPLTIEWEGETYTLTAEELAKHAKPGFFRKYRNLTESDMAWVLMELLERDDILDMVDDSWAAMEHVGDLFGKYFKRVLAVVMKTR